MPEEANRTEVTADPVFSTLHLPLCRTFFPLGYPLIIETNSHDVLQAAEESWGEFERMFGPHPVRVCLGVAEGHADCPVSEPVIRAREHLMSIVAGPENFMFCDFDRSFAFGWVTPSVVADRSWLRYHFLAGGASTMAQQRAFAPVHGALVARNGTGVLLCGDSLAGKSTLAYACARAGWTYISDDGAFLVRGRDDRYAIGDPHGIRFRTDAPDLFPELADHHPTLRPNGKIAIEVRTRDLGILTAPGCTVDHVVFLEREHSGPASVHRHPEYLAQEYWAQYAFLGTREVQAAQRRCHQRLLHAGLWRMQYSDLGDAVSQLERFVDQTASSPGVHGYCQYSNHQR